MTFRWQGNVYDTAEMKTFSTGNPAMPFVYLDESKGSVFVVVIDRQEGVEVRLANPAEIESLALRPDLAELRGTHDRPKIENENVGEKASSPHALIVEDDATTRHALRTLLNRSGYKIECAATISEAEAKLNLMPKCVILDLNLPDGMGTVILRQIREANLPIHVAVTTGTTDPAILDAVARLSPDVIFRKPFALTEVMSWLDAAA